MKRILIVDDHMVTRLGIYTILKDLYPGSTIDYAENGDTTIKLIQSNDYNLCTLDLNMPNTDSMELLKKIKSKSPATKVLVVSMNNEDVYALGVMKGGADGFLSKENDFSIIRHAVETIMANKKYMSEKVLNQLLSPKDKTSDYNNPFQILSERELEVAKLIIEGNSTKEIANKINLQWSTISTYKGKIYEKLNISKSVELFELWKLHKMT
jgi:two-component system invasion response regulator UvrY